MNVETQQFIVFKVILCALYKLTLHHDTLFGSNFTSHKVSLRAAKSCCAESFLVARSSHLSGCFFIFALKF